MSSPIDKFLVDLAIEFGILQKIKKKLFASPDDALKELNKALENISELFKPVSEQSKEYFQLNFDPSNQKNFSANKGKLNEFRVINVNEQVADISFHCTKIEMAYNDHLDKFFKRTVSTQEHKEVGIIFAKIFGYDSQFILQMEQFLNWLKESATVVGELVNQDNFDLANETIEKQSELIVYHLQEFDKILGIMKELRNEYDKLYKPSILKQIWNGLKQFGNSLKRLLRRK